MTRHTRLILLIAATSATLCYSSLDAVAAEPRPRPTTYIVSEEHGVFPEGIEITRDGTIYVTGNRNGAVYRGRVGDPRLKVFLPAGADGRTSAAGVHVDRFGRIWVAGYASNKLYVYAESGRLLAVRHAPGSNLNDFVFSRDAVYVTDSARGILWRAPLRGWQIGELEPWLTGDDFSPAADFLNGIVASPRGDVLLVADGGTEALHRVDVAAETVQQVRIDRGVTFAADGMLVRGRRLYGVIGTPLPDGSFPYVVRELRLNGAWTGAAFVSDSGTANRRDTPTTIAFDCDRILWVHSQFGNPAAAPPWTVTEARRVSR